MATTFKNQALIRDRELILEGLAVLSGNLVKLRQEATDLKFKYGRGFKTDTFLIEQINEKLDHIKKVSDDQDNEIHDLI